MPNEPKPPRVQIRWMIRRDMPEVLEIEREAFSHPWSEGDFIRALRRRCCIGMVVYELKTERVVGFMLYENHATRLHVLNLAVDPEYRRRGVGRAMVEKLKCKLGQRRSLILLEVREANLDAQLFFRSQGFRAISVLRDFYDDSSEDAYLMQYRHGEPLGVNRITRLDEGGACQGV